MPIVSYGPRAKMTRSLLRLHF